MDNCLFNINVCRVCMQDEQSCDLWSDKVLLEKFEFTTNLQVAKEDNLPKTICCKCNARLKVAYNFIKLAHETENNLKKFLEKVSSEFKEVTQGNKSNKKFLNEQNFIEDDLLSLVDEENHEDIGNDEEDYKNQRQFRLELEVNNVNVADVQHLKDGNDKGNDATKYNFSKDILLIHATNEIDTECEQNCNYLEIPRQDDDCKELYTENHVSEDNQTYSSSINILDSNEESEIPCQSSELAESEENHEYDTIINSQDDTIHCDNVYIDESSVDGTNQRDQVTYNINYLNEEEEMHENLVKKVIIDEEVEKTVQSVKKKSIFHRFYCHKCNRDFSTKTNLNRHMQSHEGSRPYSCTECKKSFTQKSTLKQHMYTHTGERPYVCEVCNRGFTQCKSLIFHMRRHTGEKPFHCEYCLITFRQKDALRIHILKHHVVVERSKNGLEVFSCSICQKQFETKLEFKTHMKMHTTTGEVDNVNLFQNEDERQLTTSKKLCEIETTESFNAAVVNVSASSASEPSRAKKFQCRKCFKCFALKKSLMRHLRIHSAENDTCFIECSECGLQFSSAEIHQDHLWDCHQDGRPDCPELEFKTIQELKIHMFDHDMDQQEQ